jgi:hypothetical protein
MIKRAKNSNCKDLNYAIYDSNNEIIISDGKWNLVDLVCGIIDKGSIDELLFTTYSITETTARRIAMLVDSGKIKKVTCVLDCYMERRYPAVVQLLSGFANITYADIHAKICLIDAEMHGISIIGSANWTNNKRIESYQINYYYYDRDKDFNKYVQLLKAFEYDNK